ncbi:TlpA family protein disulfide reductase [Lysobacter capsici]|uniref:TlpA family protein disulfide reductase n=1 Tax=Lysobacter capsici TaxID=435897 RepID=UPI001BFFDAE3|nr:TlpA disulfide reductase family protein [Lysobacter capsici]QWF18998.1 TlpA family protein disulfide reductase [Lysobacter capsici]
MALSMRHHAGAAAAAFVLASLSLVATFSAFAAGPAPARSADRPATQQLASTQASARIAKPDASAGTSKATTPDPQSRRSTRTAPQRGDIPPDFLGVDRDGRPIKVSDYRGKLVVISFWASWCAPCRRELPMLSALQAGVGREHLQVIAINLNEPRRDFDAFLKLNPSLEMSHIRDAGTVARHYGVTAVPNLFVIDQRGAIAQVHRGYSPQQLRQFAEEIAALLPPEALKRPAAAGKQTQ